MIEKLWLLKDFNVGYNIRLTFLFELSIPNPNDNQLIS